PLSVTRPHGALGHFGVLLARARPATMERSRVGLLFLALCLLRVKVSGRNPTCHFLWELQRAELVCHYELKKQSMEPAGCGGLWDNISCWAPAAVGEVVTLSCPPALTHLFGRQGNISRNCTEAGWSDVYPSLSTVCWSSDNKPNMVGCKVSLVMFNYFIMANFFWLLVEGLYLHTLLLVTYAYTHLAVYLTIGWGKNTHTLCNHGHEPEGFIPV
ncbi:unnamed protein product, partial [Oncorhynchus mykiss]